MYFIFIHLLLLQHSQSFIFSKKEIFDFLSGRGIFQKMWDRVEVPTVATTDLLIKKAGFHSEIHKLITDDGYVLHLSRIKPFSPGPPVLMVHGLFQASDMWLQQGRGKDLAFILADQGFDCWLADLRGNIFSHEHKSLNATDKKFWDFSLDEIALHDLPTLLYEVLNKTGYPKVFYIGYSMGTTTFTMLMSKRPDLRNYIQAAVLLAPVTNPPKEMKSKILKNIIKQSDYIIKTFATMHKYEFVPRSVGITTFIKLFCKWPVRIICRQILGDIAGWHSRNIDKSRVSNILLSSTSGGSVRTLEHYSQIFKTDDFKQFDFGEAENIMQYGKPRPPNYDFHNITVPLAIFFSGNDHITDDRSVEKLSTLFSNIIHKENLPEYTHVDYIFGLDAPYLLYNKIIGIFNKNR